MKIQWIIANSISEKTYTFPLSISNSSVFYMREGFEGSLGTLTISTQKSNSSMTNQQVKVYGNGNTLYTYLFAIGYYRTV